MRLRCAALLIALAACSHEPPPRPNVLLITVDTLRADHLGCYGYAKPTSPRIDQLARESLLFTRAATPRAKTTPAIASLLTGLYPHEHGVRDLMQPLRADVPLLQERLRAAGYHTAAIVANWVLADERSGLARGFDEWSEELSDRLGVPPDDVPQGRASKVTERALRALDAKGPWFLWLHYMDPHGPYDPPNEHRLFEDAPPEPLDPDAPGDDPLHKARVALYNVPADARLADGAIDVAKVRARYDGEIHYVDSEIGRVLEALRASGKLDATLVIVTADHGESLGEHRYWFEHGLYAYETTNRVPLVVRLPRSTDRAPQTGARAAPESLVDLAPTVCDFLGLPWSAPVDGLHGLSVLAQWTGRTTADGALFYEKLERADLAGAVQIKAVRIADWKLVQRYAARERDGGGGREIVLFGEELYDLARDPLETWNLAEVAPGNAPLAQLRRELARFVACDPELPELGALLARRRQGLEANDPRAARILRALGY